MRVLNDLNTYLTVFTLATCYYLADPHAEYKWWVDLIESLPFEGNDRVRFVMVSQLCLEFGFWFLVVNLTIFERLGLLEKFRLQAVPTDPEQIKKDKELTREAFTGVLFG